jgi:hypothetical protein
MNESNLKGETVNPKLALNLGKKPLDISELNETSRVMMENMSKEVKPGFLSENER